MEKTYSTTAEDKARAKKGRPFESFAISSVQKETRAPMCKPLGVVSQTDLFQIVDEFGWGPEE